MLLKDLPYGKWFSFDSYEVFNKKYFYLKTNAGISIKPDAEHHFHIYYSVIVFVVDSDKETIDSYMDYMNEDMVVEEREVFIGTSLRKYKRYSRISSIDEIKRLDFVSICIPDFTTPDELRGLTNKYHNFFCVVHDEDNFVLIDDETNLAVCDMSTLYEYLIPNGKSYLVNKGCIAYIVYTDQENN